MSNAPVGVSFNLASIAEIALSRSNSCDTAMPGGSLHRHNPARTSVSILCSNLTHGALLTTNPDPTLPTADIKVSPLCGSSNDGHETAEGDSQDCFDDWSQNPTGTVDNNTIEGMKCRDRKAVGYCEVLI
jgi:hypothetical protein